MSGVPEKIQSNEGLEQFRNCINLPNHLEEKLIVQVERNSALEEENKKLKENVEQKEQEISELKEKLEPMDTRLATLDNWMKKQREEVRMATDELSEKTMVLYSRIMEKELAKTQSKSSSERKKLTEQIQNLEDLCEEMSIEILSSNESCMEKIYNTLDHGAIDTFSHDEPRKERAKNVPSEFFLGEFTADNDETMRSWWVKGVRFDLRSTIIRKGKQHGCYLISWTSDCGKSVTSQWAPDNVERNGYRFRIEKNVLICIYKQSDLCFVVTNDCLRFNGNYNYIRK